MWIKEEGRLKKVTDDSRLYFRTSISAVMLTQLEKIAKDNNTHINYIIENGLENFLSSYPSMEVIKEMKKTRWNAKKDRKQYGSTYDRNIIEGLRLFAKTNNLYLNDIIEYSIDYVDIYKVKLKEFKNRIEN